MISHGGSFIANSFVKILILKKVGKVFISCYLSIEGKFGKTFRVGLKLAIKTPEYFFMV